MPARTCRSRTIRGNVQPRLDKVQRGDSPPSLLALAGLSRLGLEDEASVLLDPGLMVPAACQGIVGRHRPGRDTELRDLLAAIEDLDARAWPAPNARCWVARRLLPDADRRLRPAAARRPADLTGLVARTDGSFLLSAASNACAPT